MKNIYLSIILVAVIISIGHAQIKSDCVSPENDLIAAIYDFVPENALQTGDFRKLLRSENGFVETLQHDPDLITENDTTAILGADMMPQLPPISGDLMPPPAQTGANIYFDGKIAKTGSGFLLTTKLHKTSDGSVMNEVTTPFPDASSAETAGKTAATQMIQFLTTQMQSSRAGRSEGNYLINPKIILEIEKSRLKVNETAAGKVILTDCDGTRLKNREFISSARLDQGHRLLAELSGPETTDDKGEHSGTLWSKAPGIFTQTITLRYNDIFGTPKEINETKHIVIDGGEGDIWQMSIAFRHYVVSRYLRNDLQTARQGISIGKDRKKADMVFLFKVPTSPEGEVHADVIKAFNGFGEASFRGGEVAYLDEWHTIFSSGLLDQSQSAANDVKADFSINPLSKEFVFGVHGLLFRGQRFTNSCLRDKGCKTREDEYVVSDDAGGSGQITPEMTRSGVYTFKHTEKKMLDTPFKKTEISTEDWSGSYEIREIDVTIRRLGSGSGPAIHR